MLGEESTSSFWMIPLGMRVYIRWGFGDRTECVGLGTGDRTTSREGVKHIASASSVWVELSETARPTSKVWMLLVQVVLGTAATGTFAREGLGEVGVVDVRMAFRDDGNNVV